MNKQKHNNIKHKHKQHKQTNINKHKQIQTFATILVHSLYILDRIPAALTTLFGDIKHQLRVIVSESMKKAVSGRYTLSGENR